MVLARIATRYGIDPETLLEGSGIDPADLSDPMKLITLDQEKSVAFRFIDMVPLPWLGLEIGKDYHFSANGKLGMAMMCCENLLEALKMILEFSDLTASYHQYIMTIDGEIGTAVFKEISDLGKHKRFFCESEIASLHAMAHVSHIGHDVFKELHFAYPRPSYASKYQEHFHCPMFFDASCNKIIFDANQLERPLMMANPLVKQTLENECRQLLPRLHSNSSVTAKIRQELFNHPDVFPTLEDMAKRINLSPRTLRRRLMEEKTSFKAIITDIRKDKALELLKTTSLTMENVALRLGFSEVSSFYRAFKSWTGRTPNSFREGSL